MKHHYKHAKYSHQVVIPRMILIERITTVVYKYIFYCFIELPYESADGFIVLSNM